jgi:hypothetical protein
MIPSEIITGQSLIVFGLAVVAFIFLMRRMFLRPRGLNRHEQSPTDRTDVESAQLSAETVVEKLEVRLFDFAREVEGRMQSRIAVLDRLIVDADREIIRLQDLLATTNGMGRSEFRAGGPVDPRSLGTPAAGSPSARQPDVIVSQPPPTDGRSEAA